MASNNGQNTNSRQEYQTSTAAIHGRRRANQYRALTEPIVQTATYTFENTADLLQFKADKKAENSTGRLDYGRYGNPTTTAAEQRLAALENAEDGLLYSSGMAAITSVLLALLSKGDHLVITNDCYRRTREFAAGFLPKFGIESTVVPMGDYEALEEAIQPNTQLMISESPTNPYLRVVDLDRFAAVGKKHNVLTIVDGTFATPINVRPLDYGIDLVIHSGTKYLSGHNDLLSGVVLGSADLIDLFREIQATIGANPDPQNAALLLRGIKTLGVRVAQHNKNGQALAEYLEAHPQIEKVWYPGLKSHPDHQIAIEQLKGFGGVVSFTVRGDVHDTAAFIDRVKIPLIAPSLGGVESLIEQPALMSYCEHSTAEREAIGIYDNLVRFAIGIEDTGDLIEDIGQALEKIKTPEFAGRGA